VGDAGIQEQRGEPPGHAAPERVACVSIGATTMVSSSSRARTTSITPQKDETIRLYTGNAFDITGERIVRNTARISMHAGSTNRSKLRCEITQREPVEVRIVEASLPLDELGHPEEF
jgi:hypothetical protein